MTQTFTIADFNNVNANGSILTSDAISTLTTSGTTGYAVGSVYIDTPKIDILEKRIDELTKKPEVRPDTTTKLDVKNGKISVKHYKDGFFDSERFVISDIKDVTVYNKTVLVTFADGTKTVAVLDSEDDFNLEQGISICITKKLLGKEGSSVYNKLIKRAFKVKEQNEKAVEDVKKAKEAEKRRKELALVRHKKKMAKKREQEVEMYKEAIIKAIKSLKVRNKKN